MKINPKSVLGSILILLITAGATFLYLKNSQKNPSTLTLDGQQNEFRLSFNLKKDDEHIFQDFVNNLVGLTYPSEDLIFTLDATSSASLAFKTPINAKIQISEKSLQLDGNLNSALSLLKPNFEQPQIPNTAELVIVGENLTNLFYDRLNVTENSKEQLNQLITPNSGEYFTSFNSGSNFALFFKQDLDLEDLSLSDLKFESTQSASLQEFKIYQTKLPSSKQNLLEAKPVIFEKEGFKIFASSLETSNLILGAKDFIETKDEFQNSNFAIFFKPVGDFDAENFSSFISSDGLNHESFKSNFQKSLTNIKDFNLTLKGTHFSALINLK